MLWQKGREEREKGKVLLCYLTPEYRHHRDGVNGGHSLTSSPLPLIMSSVNLNPACLVGYENLSIRHLSSLWLMVRSIVEPITNSSDF